MPSSPRFTLPYAHRSILPFSMMLFNSDEMVSGDVEDRRRIDTGLTQDRRTLDASIDGLAMERGHGAIKGINRRIVMLIG